MNNLVCKECGGTNIEEKVWADPNTNVVLDTAAFGLEDYWCRNCGQHVEFVFKEEFKAGVTDELE